MFADVYTAFVREKTVFDHNNSHNIANNIYFPLYTFSTFLFFCTLLSDKFSLNIIKIKSTSVLYKKSYSHFVIVTKQLMN